MNEHIVVILCEVLIKQTLRDPHCIFMLSIVEGHLWQASVVVCTEEICPHALQINIFFLFFLSLCHMSESVNHGLRREELYKPLFMRVHVE